MLGDAPGGKPEVILIASGSEVSLCVDAHEELLAEGIRSRVVSMPSWDIFEHQTQEYQDSVLPPDVTARVAVEQASTFGWERYVGRSGRVIGMKTFGASAPLKELQRKFGFEPGACDGDREGTAGQGPRRAEGHPGAFPDSLAEPSTFKNRWNAMTKTPNVVFLFDVDNTLIDNDRVQAHLKEHLEQTYGPPRATGTGKSLKSCAANSDTSTTWARWSATGSRRCIARRCCGCRAGWSITRSPTAFIPVLWTR